MRAVSTFTEEEFIENQTIPVDIEKKNLIISQMKNCICKIKQNKKVGTGFFCKIQILGENDLLYFLITNNHILNEKDIENNKIIRLNIYDEEVDANIDKPIIIDESRKRYTYLNKEKDIDITFIEIKPDIDKIKNFLELDDEELKLEGNQYSIYSLHYHGDRKLISYGLIRDIIEEQKINFNFEIERGSSCSPILSINNLKVIGVHYGGSNSYLRYGVYIKYIIIELYRNKFKNPSLLKKIGTGIAITGGVVAGISLLPIILGFGTTGIVAGSVAAGIQAAIGNVAAGSLFAVSTSLGMTGAFVSTSAAGTALGLGGGLTAYLNNSFNPEADAKLIKDILIQDNPNSINELINIIIIILEKRIPSERETIRKKFNKLFEGEHRDFDRDIINYINDYNLKMHAINLLKITKDINAKNESVKILMNNMSFEDYLEKSFLDSEGILTSFFKKTESWTQLVSSMFIYSKNDASLIENIISDRDDPLIIIRLLEHRTEKERKAIFNINSEDMTYEEKINKKILLRSIKSYMPDYEKKYVESLLDKAIKENNIN